MDTIENAFVIQDDNHVVYRGSDHFLMFHVTNGKRFIHVHSNIGYINPFCRYIFYGRYSDQKNFRANDCSMTPATPDQLLLSKFLRIFKLRDPSFSAANWLNISDRWRSSENNDVFENDLLPIVKKYAETYADVAFFCYPETYTFVHRFYDSKAVFNWSLKTCRYLEATLTQNPFSLTFSSPVPEMLGACVDLDLLKELCPENEGNRQRYGVCEAAEFFCFNSVGVKSRSDFKPETLATLVEKEFLYVVSDKVVLKRTYLMFQQIKRLRFVSVDTNAELVNWCKNNPEFNFVTTKKFLLDTPISVSYVLDPSKKNCLLNIELWTISDVQQLLQGADPSSVWGIGFNKSVGNRCGYNMFHFIHAQIPSIPSYKFDELKLDDVANTRTKCTIVKVGTNMFHSAIVHKLRVAFPQKRGRKITFTTDVPISDVPYSFIQSIKNISDRSYRPKDRVVFDQHRSRVIKDILLDTVKTTAKRKRRSHCTSTNVYQVGKSVVIDFKNGETFHFKEIKNRLNHWGLASSDQVMGLYDDVLIFFTNDVDHRLTSSLLNCCKKLIVVVPENTTIVKKQKKWEMIDFYDIK